MANSNSRRASLGVLTLLIAQWLWLAPTRSTAADQTNRTMSTRVDEIIQTRWHEHDVQPATRSTDAEFMRRVYLDLCGLIPTVAQSREFLADTHPEKRARLIDTLLSGPNYPTHLAGIWRRILLPEAAGGAAANDLAGFQAWLRDQFLENHRYDNIVADLLVTRGSASGMRPTLFYTAAGLKPEALATTSAKVFLGVQIGCAQCHDHPFDDWSQRDFWGYAAFFARLTRPPENEAMMQVQVVDIRDGEVTLPESEEIVSPRFLGGDASRDRRDDNRRRQLAIWMASRENPYLARAAVNRIWGQLFGRGIVEPVDDFGAHNPPSHPDLLDELSEYFVRSSFDLRELYRVLANTGVYQLSSRLDGEDVEWAPEHFARMAIKPLTAEQLYDSLSRATGRRATNNSPGRPGDERFNDPQRQQFLARFRAGNPNSREYESGIPQALTLMNGNLIRAATDLEQSNLLVALSADFFSVDDQVEIIFLATFARPPTEAERTSFVAYVSEHREGGPGRRRALGDGLWALLNSAEFALNH